MVPTLGSGTAVGKRLNRLTLPRARMIAVLDRPNRGLDDCSDDPEARDGPQGAAADYLTSS
jgi:hypothetical protein